MLFYNFETEKKAYKLRLDTMNTIELEKRIGGNPLSIFGNGDRLPTITEMVNVLHCALQPYNHGITIKDTYAIFDDYLADGNSATDFIAVIVDIYKASGIIKEEGAETEKN